MTTTIKEVINNPKLHNLECVVLQKKPDVVPPHRPTKHKKSKFDLIMERLDKYDELFKAHGWIK